MLFILVDCWGLKNPIKEMCYDTDLIFFFVVVGFKQRTINCLKFFFLNTIFVIVWLYDTLYISIYTYFIHVHIYATYNYIKAQNKYQKLLKKT